jgi:hypothetical protein
MSFWEKIQKDIKRNLKEGIDLFRERSSTVTKKLEWLTEEGKKRYKLFNLNMKVQEEFAHLGGRVYDLMSKNVDNPLANKRVQSIFKKIKRLEAQINRLEGRDTRAKKKSTVKRTSRKRSSSKGSGAASSSGREI